VQNYLSTYLVDAARPVGASPPPVRHGTCSPLWVRINGVWYTVHTLGDQPGFSAVWQVRKQDPERSAAYTVAQQARKEPGCTCPDHELNGFLCKHIRALQSVGLLKKPRPRKPCQSRKRDLRLHARNARKAIAEANALPVEARRHLAEIAPPAEDFAAGFRAAIRDELARMGGTPAEPRPALCELCGDPFDPAASRDPRYCTECLEGGAL
jgi:hypothetical protein